MKKLSIISSELEKLAALENQAPASIYLTATEYDHISLKALVAALTEHGAALGALDLSLAFPQHPYHHDLHDFDFAAACPHLESLSVGRCRVNASVLLHPTLRQLSLRHCWLTTPDPFRLGYPGSPASQLSELTLRGVNWGNDEEDLLSQCAFGPDASLQSFTYSLDEDDSERYPEALIFDGCPELAEVRIGVCGGWMALFKGDLPHLARVGLSSQRYGDHRISFGEIGDGSSAYALRLRDGKGPFAGEQYIFVGTFPYLNLDKVRHIITALGGVVVENAAPELSFAILSDEEYAAYESGTPSPQVAEIAALVAQGTDINIYALEAFRDMISGWY